MSGLHTPGPWHNSDNGEHHGHRLIYAPDGYLVADAGRIQRRTDTEQDANARLIAAAPELVECVRDWVEYMKNNGCDRDNIDWDRARAALEKAGVAV